VQMIWSFYDIVEVIKMMLIATKTKLAKEQNAYT